MPDDVIKIFSLQEMVEEGGDVSVWGALLATLVARLGGEATISPYDMAEALSNKEMVLERIEGDGETSLSIRVKGYSPSERN